MTSFAPRLLPLAAALLLSPPLLLPCALGAEAPPSKTTAFEDRDLIERKLPAQPSFPHNYRPARWDSWHNPGALTRFSLRGFLGIASFQDEVVGTDVKPYPVTYDSLMGTTNVSLGVEFSFSPMKFIQTSVSITRFQFKADKGSEGSTLVDGTDILVNFGDFSLVQFLFSLEFRFPINIFNITRDEPIFPDDLFNVFKAVDLEGIVPYLRAGAGVVNMGKLTARRQTDLGGGNWVETKVNYLDTTKNFLFVAGMGIEFKFAFLSLLVEFDVHLNGTPDAGFEPWADPEAFVTWHLLAGVGFHL